MREYDDEYKRKVDYPDSYIVSNYDNVYVLLNKHSVSSENYKDFLHHDKIKDRYYLQGKIVKFDRFPFVKSIALLPKENFEKFRKADKKDEKEKCILSVYFSDIEFINLDFNSFDWK